MHNNYTYVHVCVVYKIVFTVDGGWGPWKLGTCSVTCGKGILVRTRSCNNPSPSNGGTNCVGLSTERLTCSERCCQGTELFFT